MSKSANSEDPLGSRLIGKSANYLKSKIVGTKILWKKSKKLTPSKKSLIYVSLIIEAAVLICLMFSKEETKSSTLNGLPIKDNYAVKLVSHPMDENSQKKFCGAKKGSERNTVQDYTKDKNENLRKEVLAVIKDTPMEPMVDKICEKDKTVAAFLVGIAMKESKFGVYSPKKNGRDCYNYWGYRGRENPTASGYSCFSSPEQAVEVVGNKIERLTQRGIKSPAQMISWKCGSSCAGHSRASVNKWVYDVNIYFRKLMRKKET